VRRASRRVLVFWIVSLLVAGLAGAWLRHALSSPSTEERTRQEAERIKERIHDLTH
jgi:hypothetical protein